MLATSSGDTSDRVTGPRNEPASAFAQNLPGDVGARRPPVRLRRWLQFPRFSPGKGFDSIERHVRRNGGGEGGGMEGYICCQREGNWNVYTTYLAYYSVRICSRFQSFFFVIATLPIKYVAHVQVTDKCSMLTLFLVPSVIWQGGGRGGTSALNTSFTCL